MMGRSGGKLSNFILLEDDWLVLGVEETGAQQDRRSQPETAVTAYSEETDSSQIAVLPTTARSVLQKLTHFQPMV